MDCGRKRSQRIPLDINCQFSQPPHFSCEQNQPATKRMLQTALPSQYLFRFSWVWQSERRTERTLIVRRTDFSRILRITRRDNFDILFSWYFLIFSWSPFPLFRCVSISRTYPSQLVIRSIPSMKISDFHCFCVSGPSQSIDARYTSKQHTLDKKV